MFEHKSVVTSKDMESPVLRCDLLKRITKEFAEIIDETLLPTTTVSSLGLKIALILKDDFLAFFENEQSASKQERFASALVKLMRKEFEYSASYEITDDYHIRLIVGKCAFKANNSESLCSIMHGIIGGLAMLVFGYCKVLQNPKTNNIAKPCVMDLYIKDIPECKDKIGVEYSKENIALLRGFNENLGSEQRQARRKIIIGIFADLALALKESPDEARVGTKFLASLSNIPGLLAAAMYLKGKTSNSYNLVANYGFSEEVIPLISRLDIENDEFDDKGLILPPMEELSNELHRALRAQNVRYMTSVKIKIKEYVTGFITLGWISPAAVTPEVSEAIRSACTLLGASINGMRLYSDLEKAHIESISIINKLVGLVDKYGGGHSTAVADLAEEIAEEMGLKQEQINLVYEAGMVHDIGKVNIPPEIINKPGRLTDKEYELVKEHPKVGADLLKPLGIYKELIPAVLYHHERLDGSGYPEGLKGDQIPLLARIIAVADVYDAMTSERAYRPPFTSEDALEVLKADSGCKFDPTVVKALVAVINRKKQLAA